MSLWHKHKCSNVQSSRNRNFEGLQNRDARISGLENQSLWQRLNSSLNLPNFRRGHRIITLSQNKIQNFYKKNDVKCNAVKKKYVKCNAGIKKAVKCNAGKNKWC